MITFKRKSERTKFIELKQAWRALEKLSTIRTRYPDLRIGQILSNAIQDKELFYISDQKLFECLDQLLENLDDANG